MEISPSILSADFSRLGEQVAACEQAGVTRLHIDVMDGHFVPNLSMGPVVVQGLRPRTKLLLEVHLMIDNPAKFIAPFCDAGADLVLVHHEVLPDPVPVLDAIKARGVRAGLVLNPDTPTAAVESWLPRLDMVLCMTVFPGFGGQPFLPESPDRIRALRALIDRLQPRCDLEVDGGIDARTAPLAVAAGANVLVAGNAIFRHPRGIGEAIAELRNAQPR